MVFQTAWTYIVVNDARADNQVGRSETSNELLLRSLKTNTIHPNIGSLQLIKLIRGHLGKFEPSTYTYWRSFIPDKSGIEPLSWLFDRCLTKCTESVNSIPQYYNLTSVNRRNEVNSFPQYYDLTSMNRRNEALILQFINIFQACDVGRNWAFQRVLIKPPVNHRTRFRWSVKILRHRQQKKMRRNFIIGLREHVTFNSSVYGYSPYLTFESAAMGTCLISPVTF